MCKPWGINCMTHDVLLRPAGSIKMLTCASSMIIYTCDFVAAVGSPVSVSLGRDKPKSCRIFEYGRCLP